MGDEDFKIVLPAFKVTQPIGSFFMALMSASELEKISFADVRRMEREQDKKREVEKYLGIQRPLRDDRVKELQQYTQGNDASFPTSIILSVDSRCANWNENRQILTLFPYKADPSIPDDKDIPIERIAQVLDGQHRVAGLQNWDEAKGPFELPVSVFVGADISTQSTIFATVNLTQTKVNRSLVYDLFELAEARSPQKTAHDVAVVLDESEKSPLYRRIKRLGVATEGRFGELLTQATVVESLLPYISANPSLDRQLLLAGKSLQWPTPTESSRQIFRTLFIQKKDELIANSVWNYFDAVSKRWPVAWNDTNRGALLPRTNGFKAMMRLLRPVYYALKKVEGSMLESGEVFTIFEKSKLKDEEFNTSNYPPGTSGEAALYKSLRDELDLPTSPLIQIQR
jgi:DGQHR domain-containing protein